MRLEWHSEIEVERPLAGPDPLRAIFKPDAEFNEDGMQDVQRSLADRLVFEAAKDHKAQISADHRICVLTSDQGLARMVLSEGMVVVYFEARQSGSPLGKTLTGTLFHPLTAKLHTISLTKVLWELATCFGSARLNCDAGQFQVTAMSEALPWFPYQSREDLLWCRWTARRSIPTSPSTESKVENEGPPNRTDAKQLAIEMTEAVLDSASVKQILIPTAAQLRHGDPAIPRGHSLRIGGNVFSVQKMLRLVVHLARSGEMEPDEVQQLLGLSKSSIREYGQFLKSGGYVILRANVMVAEPPLQDLAAAVMALKLDEIAGHLQRIPSFLAYLNLVVEHQKEPLWNPANYMRNSTSVPYRMLAEISGLCVSIPGAGITLTTTDPSLTTFCDVALSVYKEMAFQDQWVLAGAWLEELALRELIHPLRTRKLLNAAVEAELLRRYSEGSTIETRFEDHKLAVLKIDENGEPVVLENRLYHGDFLAAGRASVRIQLERGSS